MDVEVEAESKRRDGRRASIDCYWIDDAAFAISLCTADALVQENSTESLLHDIILSHSAYALFELKIGIQKKASNEAHSASIAIIWSLETTVMKKGTLGRSANGSGVKFREILRETTD